MCAAVKTYRIGKFDLNPRGNLWVKDENKFGQKLLSKMGWSEGKGLGKNENGIKESIKVRMKIGHSGVGFTDKMPLKSHDYEAVLESLSNKFKSSPVTTTPIENNLKGLEQRSQQFRNRLHYQKFVRGKDVGRYSEKDMNSIFVTRKTDVEPVVVPLKSNVTNVESNPSENAPPESMPTFKSQMSMSDYFAMKLQKKSGEPCKQSLLCNEKTQDLEDSPPKDKVLSKKRKRELKNSSKNSKKLKTLQSKDTEDIQAFPEIKVSIKIENNELSEGKISPVSKKEKKNKKFKIDEKLIHLKSCLKKTFSTNLWFKQDKKEVSFNDSISYKIIENVLNDKETDFTNNEIEGHYAMDCFEEDIDSIEEDTYLIDSKTSPIKQVSDAEHSNHIGNLTNHEVDESKDKNSDELEEGEIECENEDTTPKCFELPKCDKSNYNTWLESQRIATKMKVYKNMAKKFRKNPVLKTSNLFDIKGYGNWGL